MTELGRAFEPDEEVKELWRGMDFRQPVYRRETFLRFYEFHLRYRAHPGCVYYVMPHLAQDGRWTLEEKLWYAYLNGNTQHPVTSWVIFRAFPDLRKLNRAAFKAWFEANYERLEFDTDRRYFKKSFLHCVFNYLELLRGKSQAAMFNALCPSADPAENFRSLWPFLNKYLAYFGRLSVFSYVEYLSLSGIPVSCDRLFLEDIGGSRSHRNGLCKVLGRDDLDWHDSNPHFEGYSPQVINWLKQEGALLLEEATERMKGRPYAKDVGYFTLESALCTYKSWHRPNRRYPNVYNDMFHDRIKKSEKQWSESFDTFWKAREFLPDHLRLECSPKDPGCVPEKQNFYRMNGCPVMMDRDWPCFQNEFNDRLALENE